MAASVINTLDSLLWSGDIPDLTISVSDHVNVALEVDSTVIYTATLYSNSNSQAKFVEIAELVEQHMVDTGKSVSTVTIYEVADNDPTSMTSLCSFVVVYSVADVQMACGDFCRTHFLTLAESKRLVPGITEHLSFYTPPSTNASPETLIVQVGYQLDGRTAVVTVSNASSLVTGNEITFTVASIKTLASVDDVNFITLSLGARHIHYYSIFPPDATFLFRNYFNALEVLPLNCVTDKKQNGSRNIASVRRTAVLASIHHEVEHEVETAPLSPCEAVLVEQLVESPKIYLLPSQSEIVISERTCKLTDERGTMPNASFTWSYIHGRPKAAVETVADSGIFSEEYNDIFD